MSQKRKRAADAIVNTIDESDVFRSDRLEDRSSVFIGYFSPSIPAKQLQALAEFKDASHKILAWRKPGNQRLLVAGSTQYDMGHDDDGEKYGGKKVEKVLESLGAVGACVVARWYGGVMLGPVRFSHMEQCAREAVAQWRAHDAEQRVKRQRAAADDADRSRIAASLADRDQSIAVLRALAAEKEEAVTKSILAGTKSLDPASAELIDGDTAVSPSRRPQPVVATSKPDYTTMPLERLKALEKARDATLSFLLKRIDQAESKLTAIDGDAKSVDKASEPT